MGLAPKSPAKKRPSRSAIRAAQLFAPPSVVRATMGAANTKIKQAESRTTTASKKAETAKSQDNNNTKEDQNATAFTTAEDARILAWKAANESKPWKTLAEEMRRSELALKSRFKEIKNTDAPGKTNDTAKEKSKEGKDAANTGKKVGSEKKAKLDNKDDEMVSSLIKEDDQDRWLRIASRYFDATGREVHPEDLKDRFSKR